MERRDNQKELDLGILRRADTIEELAKLTISIVESLAATVARWNAQCDGGEDTDFGCPPGRMIRIDQPPFIFGQVWPAVSNTQGGPVHNARQEIVDTGGNPIRRLYAAGELGS